MSHPGHARAATRIRCLLLQLRDPDDEMAPHEVSAFGRALSPLPVEITPFNLLRRPLTEADLGDIDLVLMGGSGNYSATSTEPWLDVAVKSLRQVHASGIPAFASCWGFQGMAVAMGGRVVHDPDQAEVGTLELRLTSAGRTDPLFGPLGDRFRAQLGHEDSVIELPARTTLLASSARVDIQAYRFDDAPIYCTQFHPELHAADMRARFLAYPRYVTEIARKPLEHVVDGLRETPEVEALVRRFAEMHLPGSGAGIRS